MSEAKTKTSFLTVKLEYPFTNGAGERVSEIILRRAKGSDLRAMQQEFPGDEAQGGYLLAQRVSGLIPEDFDELDIADLQTVLGKVTAMAGKPQASKPSTDAKPT